jgi:fibronectin-binding autotransporter adhesin
MKSRRALKIIVPVVVAFSGRLVESLNASTNNWTGNGVNSNWDWSAGADWSLGVKPAAGQDLVINNSATGASGAMYLQVNMSASSVTFNDSAITGLFGNKTTNGTVDLVLTSQASTFAVFTLGFSGASVMTVGHGGPSNSTASLFLSYTGTRPFEVDDGNTLDLTDPITSSVGGGIEKTGSGILKLGDTTLTSNFNGGFQLSAGTVQFGSTAGVGSDGMTFAGGTATSITSTVTVTNSGAIIGSFTLGNLNLSGNYSLSVSNPTLTVLTSSTTTFGGVISDSGGGFTKAGSGTLVLSGSNTFTGAASVAAGTLKIGASGGVPASMKVQMSTSTATASTFDASGFDISLGSLSGGSTASTVLIDGHTLTIGTLNTSTTFAGNFSGTTGALVKQGTGTLTLLGNNSATGSVSVLNGTLSIANVALGGPLGNDGLVIGAVSTSGTLQYTDGNATAARAVTFAGSGGTLSVTNSTATLNLSGAISGTGAITKDGAGTLVLSGTNTFSGALAVDAGTLAAATIASAGDTTSTNALTVRGGATFSYRDVSASLARSIVADTSGGTIEVTTAATTLTFSGGISGTGAFTKSGAGKLQVANVRNGAGGLTVSAGSLVIPNDTNLIADGGTAGACVVTGLTVGTNTTATTAQLDLNNNAMIVNYSSTSPLLTVRAILSAGFNQGTWDGKGISSSAAGADLNISKPTALGYADTTQVSFTTVRGQTVSGNAVVIKYTYYGDANLDGVVDNTADYNAFINGESNGGSTWAQGDFTYDGVVDLGNDFNLYLYGYNYHGAALPGLFMAAPDPWQELADRIMSTGQVTLTQKAEMLELVDQHSGRDFVSQFSPTIVPEPTGAVVFAAPTLLGLARRCRR